MVAAIIDPVSHNGKETPIGIETNRRVCESKSGTSHNGKENPIEIELLRRKT